MSVSEDARDQEIQEEMELSMVMEESINFEIMREEEPDLELDIQPSISDRSKSTFSPTPPPAIKKRKVVQQVLQLLSLSLSLSLCHGFSISSLSHNLHLFIQDYAADSDDEDLDVLPLGQTRFRTPSPQLTEAEQMRSFGDYLMKQMLEDQSEEDEELSLRLLSLRLL
jgi:hypothetical protein